MRHCRLLVLALAALPLLAFSCADGPTDPDFAVDARFEADGLVVTNHARVALYYMAINPRSLALWALCTEPATCPRLEPGATVTIPPDGIGGWTGDPDANTAEVHFWRLAPVGDGHFEAVDRGFVTARRY